MTTTIEQLMMTSRAAASRPPPRRAALRPGHPEGLQTDSNLGMGKKSLAIAEPSEGQQPHAVDVPMNDTGDLLPVIRPDSVFRISDTPSAAWVIAPCG